MVSGIPVVAARATCIPEIVHDQENGYLIPPGDVEAMAERIMDILRTPALAHRMGEAGRHIAERHAHGLSVSLHEGVYQSLISNHVSGAFNPSPQFARVESS
jgi:glycosyltransferase involved in cell wall biosynthesis